MAVSYYFRFMSKGKPTGHIGLAIASSMRELFWEIDQYGDPSDVQIHPVQSGSFCIKVVETEDEISFREFELTDYIPDADSKKWRNFDRIIANLDPYTPTSVAREIASAGVSQ